MTFKGLKGFTPRLRVSYWTGCIPPPTLLNIIGLGFIIIGFTLQIFGNLK